MNHIDWPTFESSTFIEATFNFWYQDNEHIRSPFPNYIQSNLKKKATDAFFNWLNNIKPEAKDELNDEAIAEKFEELIFETALPMIVTEEERITILYPFLPRSGDQLTDDVGLESTVLDRRLEKTGDHHYLHLSCRTNETDEKWETSFELPA